MFSLSKLLPTSLKVRVVLAMGLIFVCAITALALTLLKYFEIEFRKNLYKSNLELVTSVGNGIDEKLRLTQKALVQSTLSLPAEILNSGESAQRYLDNQTGLLSIFDNGLLLFTPEGKLIAESPYREGRRGLDISSREFYRAIVATRKPYISKPFVSTIPPRQPAIAMAVPLLDAQGKLIGLMTGGLNLLGENFLADLRRVQLAETGYLFLTTRDRLIITTRDSNRIMSPAAAAGKNLLYDQALNGFEGTGRTTNSLGIEMFATYRGLRAVDWILSANMPVAEAETPLYKLQATVISSAVASTLLVLGLAWLVMLKLTRPLHALTRHVRELPNKTGAARAMKPTSTAEIAELTSAFNQLVQSHDDKVRETLASEDRFRGLTSLSADWYWEQGPDLRFTIMSHGVSNIGIGSTIGKLRWELPIPSITPAQWAAHRAVLERREPFKDFNYEIETATGGLPFVFSISGVPFFDANGEFLGYRGIGSDITERVRSKAQIEHLAYHDALTGLPNRLLMQDRCEQAMAQADREGSKVALVFLDLDNFKSINDSLGHDAGDALLQQVAARLQECVRDTDTLSRQGGDEFLLVLRELPDVDVASAIMLKIIGRLQETFTADEQEVLTSVSMGAAIYPDNGGDFETLRKHADIAMYQAKSDGRNTYRFFDPIMNQGANNHLTILNGVRQALLYKQFELHYQPQIELTSQKIIGVEALIRWNHPDLGQLGPNRFIQIAEESGLIVPMGEWVLHEACRQAAAWEREGLVEFTMAVNVSAVQFKRGDLEQSVTDALLASGLDPRRLELELTESTLIQNVESVLATVKRIKKLGVKISIDDFGTGYSSLSYLKRFDIDKLKIDQSFVRDLATDPDDAAIVRAIIQMAHSLSLVTIAEGVETEEIKNLLHEFGCDEAQGYLFARPMSAEQLVQFMAQKNAG